MKIILYFLGAFILSYVMMPYAIKLGERFFMDYPNNRKLHKCPKPRSGGIAVLTSGFIFILLSPIEIKFISPLILIFMVGILDDLINIPAIYKFLAQILVALMAYLIGIQITSINLLGSTISLGIFALPFTILWLTAIMNAFNIIDGLDGLASGLVLTSSVFLAILCLLFSHDYLFLLLLIIAGALLGFLPYNLSPSKVFLGDAGSLSLGYIIAISSSLLVTSRHEIDFLGVMLIIFVPILDTSWSIIRRAREGKSIFKADRGHIHHKLSDTLSSDKTALACIILWSSFIGLMGLMISVTSNTVYIVLCLFIAVVSSVLLYNIDQIKSLIDIKKIILTKANKDVPVAPIQPKKQGN